ncbi:MAG: portal protein, partial [Clostridia bacterium]
MSGFILDSTRKKSAGLLNSIQRNIRELGLIGMSFDSKLIKQSKSVGIADVEAQSNAIYNPFTGTGNSGQDATNKEFIAFYDKEYPLRRDFLRKFALNGEIEYVLDILADETIIYDESNYFAYPDTKNLKKVLKEEKAKEIVDDLNESYKRIYSAFNFNNGHDAWHFFKKYLIDGFLAFEIIFDVDDDNNATNIIGFKELDPISLEPEIRINSDGQEYRVWVQYRGDADKQRELLDSNLIYISWARSNFVTRLSYVERLVRVFNMLRTMENTRIIWNVQNAQKRVKIGVPVGSLSYQQSKTRLSEFRAMYKEDVTIDYHSGEVSMNGQPNFPFNKTYIVPINDGQQIDISEIESQGYDMNSTEQLKYFWNRFIIETKIPKDRFNFGDEQGSNWESGDNGIPKEELRYANFINRIRSTFQDILLKPMWIQFCLKHPEFKNDHTLKSSIGLLYAEENLFKLAKERQVAQGGANVITTLSGIQIPMVQPDGTMGTQPYFDIKFLADKYMSFRDEDFELNDKYRKDRTEENLKLQKAYMQLQAAQNAGQAGNAGMAGGVNVGAGGDVGAGGGMADFSGGFGGGGQEGFGDEFETSGFDAENAM